ncbi:MULTISPECIES: hypothetical protein [unclassified Sulfitobacter]|uniref:hypothetical protein n=1 Tax=unclassified Sulfitobacter TaxID=196795 RepID=UPI0023E2C351|nr:MULTISPECIES: hypothetical protein [unclassified Sulfitobacter]
MPLTDTTAPALKYDNILLLIEINQAVGKMVVGRDLFECMPEALQIGPNPWVFQKLVQPDLERRLRLTHRVRDLVNKPFDRFPKPKIITVKSPDRFSADAIKDPLIDLDLCLHDEAIFPDAPYHRAKDHHRNLQS